MSKRLIACAALGLLVACASPQERCIANASKDLRVVDGLIAELRLNISRGYAIETEQFTVTDSRICRDSDGKAHVCTSERVKTTSSPVAIDLNAERAKLASLEEKRRELAARTQRELAACRGV